MSSDSDDHSECDHSECDGCDANNYYNAPPKVKQFLSECESGNICRIKELINDLEIQSYNKKHLAFYASVNHLDVIKLLLTYPMMDPSYGKNVALLSLCDMYNRMLYCPDIALLLLQDNRVVNSLSDKQKNIMFYYSCFTESTVMKYLLQDPRFTPYNGLLEIATYGYEDNDCNYHSDDPEKIQLLLSDPRIDPSKDNSGYKALQSAFDMEYFKIAEVLLKDTRIDPSIKNNKFLRKWCKYDDSRDIVEMLLLDNRVRNGDIECVKKHYPDLYNQVMYFTKGRFAKRIQRFCIKYILYHPKSNYIKNMTEKW
jgi:hypothetical protein